MGKRKFFAYDTDRTGNMDEVRTLAEIQMEDLPFHGKLTEPFLTLTNKDFYPSENNVEDYSKLPTVNGVPGFCWSAHGYYLIRPMSVMSDWLTDADKVAWKLTVRVDGEVAMTTDNTTAACLVTKKEEYTRYEFWSNNNSTGTSGPFGNWDIGFMTFNPSEDEPNGYATVMLYENLLNADITFEIFKVTPAKTLPPEVTGFTRVIFSDFNRNDNTFKCSMTAREIMAAACKGPVYGYVGDPDVDILDDIMILTYLGSENVPIAAYFGVPNYEMWHLGTDMAPAWGISVIDGEERAKRVSRVPA